MEDKAFILQTINEHDHKYEQRFSALEKSLAEEHKHNKVVCAECAYYRGEATHFNGRQGLSWGVAMSVIGLVISTLAMVLVMFKIK